MPTFEEIDTLACEPRNERNVNDLCAKCMEVVEPIGRSYLWTCLPDGGFRNEIDADLLSIIGEAFIITLEKCTWCFMFSYYLCLKVKGMIIDQIRRIRRHWVHHIRTSNLEEGGAVDVEDDRATHQPDLFVADTRDNPFEILVEREMSEAVASGRNGLSPREAEVIRLWLDYEMETSAIALQMRIKETTVRVLMMRGRTKIARYIQQRFKDGLHTRAR